MLYKDGLDSRDNVSFQNSYVSEQKQVSFDNDFDNCCMSYQPMPQMSCTPIYECPIKRVCHRCTNIEVPHIVPINTTIVNHEIYNHTYTPCYTYNEVVERENRCM